MANDPKNIESEADAYERILNLYWIEGPGDVGKGYKTCETQLLNYLTSPEKTDNAAVAQLFMASDELLVAGNLIAKKRLAEGWAWMDKAQARAYWSYQAYSHTSWSPSGYSRFVFDLTNFCAFFSLALARGNEQQIVWYAQQLYNLRRGGVAGLCCKALDYLDFYWETAIAVLNNAWPSADELSENMGIYRDLFLAAGDGNIIQDALVACARYHLDLAAFTPPKNEEQADHPFRTLYIGHIAYELMAWLALHKRFFGPLIVPIRHPMFLAELVNPPSQQPYTDKLIEKFRMNANVHFGGNWAIEIVPSIDSL